MGGRAGRGTYSLGFAATLPYDAGEGSTAGLMLSSPYSLQEGLRDTVGSVPDTAIKYCNKASHMNLLVFQYNEEVCLFFICNKI